MWNIICLMKINLIYRIILSIEFFFAVIGKVENKEIYFNIFYRMLKIGGILSLSELAGDPI